MRDEYERFLQSKHPADLARGRVPTEVHESLFDFQGAITRWAIKRGQAAIFADTGLGKTRMQLEWLRQMSSRLGLIVTPLAVAGQTIEEAGQLDMSIRFASDQPREPGLWVTNYEKLHRFDPAGWDAIVLDESSILKSITGKTRDRLIRDWSGIPYRLCCTATPAPNDIEELANHAEFLSAMTRRDMLASFFVHDDQHWRLKGHAREPFFHWMAGWAVYVRKPSDLGFSDERFALPPLRINEHKVAITWRSDGDLFPAMLPGVRGRRIARKESLQGRVAKAAELIRQRSGQWLVWCGLNAEQHALQAVLGEECVSIEGATSGEDRLAGEAAWRSGNVSVLITKPAIFGWGLNWQHCHQMIFLGLSDSWEEYYQAIRRCWRFGQTAAVDIEVVISEAEGRVAENIWRKEQEHMRTAGEVLSYIGDSERAAVSGAPLAEDYAPAKQMELPAWIQ